MVKQKINPTEGVSATKSTPDWDVIIAPRGRYIHMDFGAIWHYRDLILMFFKRDFVSIYKQTILGPLWYLIQPTLTALTYYIVFGKIARLPTAGLPPFLFYMSGIVLWGYFAACLTGNSEIFSKNANLFSKVYFPRLIVPISVAMSGLVTFTIQFVLLLLVILGFFFYDIYNTLPGVTCFFAPALVLYVAALGLGVGLIVSAVTVRFRDLAFATGFVTQLWMYASPVVYAFPLIPPKYQWFFYLNPMVAPLETLRYALFHTQAPSVALWVTNFAIMICTLVAGVFLFTRAESSAMDTI